MEYHDAGSSVNSNRVVGFFVEPISVKHSFEGGYNWDTANDPKGGYDKVLKTCDKRVGIQEPLSSGWQDTTSGASIIFSYDVLFVESDTEWASRWDIYLDMDGPSKIHWLSILNSVVVVLLLSAVVGAVLLRAIKHDISKYNRLPLSEPADGDDVDEKGWKLVHADVFRPPSFRPLLFCVFVGNGAQASGWTLYRLACTAAYLTPLPHPRASTIANRSF